MRKNPVDEGLARIERVLRAPTTEATVTEVPSPRGPLLGSLALVVLAGVSSSGILMLPAIGLALWGGWRFARRAGIDLVGVPPERGLISSSAPRVGMGADIASGAVLEPGCTVEMGATIREGARIESGAVIRMGAMIGRNAVIERGAVVWWGGTVREDATVETEAVVGPGAMVAKGAVVPAGSRVGAGVKWSQGVESLPPREKRKPDLPEKKADPRVERIDAACRRLDAELAAAPASVREFLGTSASTIATLHRTSHDLLQREARLRAEIDPAATARLEQERSALVGRRDAAVDAHVRESLSGAMGAIDEQLRQRGLVARAADRLEAESTRLLYTFEGLAAQLVRLRASGDTSVKDPALEASVVKLRSEVDAIADAIEEVSKEGILTPHDLGAPPEPVSDVTSGVRERS